MDHVVSSTGLAPAYRRLPARLNAKRPASGIAQPAFQGSGVLDSTRQETGKVLDTLFGDPGKNMMWSLGYGIGGIMLTPITPVAIGAFCMAGVHLLSASYQFLTKSPDEPSHKKETPHKKESSHQKNAPKFSGQAKRLSFLA